MSIADQITKAWNNANATVDQYTLKAKKAPKSSDLQSSLFETSQQPALPGHGEWNEEAHPRVAKGSQQAHGGQFTSKESVDALPGGKADGKPDSAFKPTLLEQGKKVESEHTNKPAIAKEIAKDHLSEDPNYYDKLKKMEQGPKSKPADRTALEVPKPAENSAAKSGDQMGLFGEVANVKPDKSEKTGFKPTLLDQAKQPPLFDTKGHKDQIMMFDDGITPEDRLLKHNDSDEYPFAGMSLDQAAELASRHGHDYEEAKRKINNRPSSWISVLKGWQLEEKANRNELTREKRNAKWKPSEIQAEILKIIGTGKKFHKTQDMLTYSKYRTAMQSLVNRGVIDRVDGASEIYYKLSPRMKAQDALSEDQKN